MTREVRGVVEHGLIRPLEDLHVPEGSEVEVVVVDLPRTVEEREAKAKRILEALASVHEEARKYPAEWWDEFQKELVETRFTVPERL